MHLINQSPYDSRALRQIVTAARRYILKYGRQGFIPFHWWKNLILRVLVAGAREPDLEPGQAMGAIVRVPKLTGNEWHQIARQQVDDGFTPLEFFRRVVNEVWGAPMDADAGPYLDRLQKKLGVVIPLKVAKPKPPPDQLTVRFRRVVELEARWLRKQKLAATKVKAYRVKRRYYEKRLAARKETT